MPAIPILLQLLIVAFFGPDIMKKYNLNPTDLTTGFGGGSASQAASPVTPGAKPEPTKPPPFKQTLNDAVHEPISLFGIAAVGFVAVFFIAQVRAGTHEAVETTKDLYNAGSKATGSLANADAGTRNTSRRMKK